MMACTIQSPCCHASRWYFQQLIITLDYLHRTQPGTIHDMRLEDLLLAVSGQMQLHDGTACCSAAGNTLHD